MNWPDLIEDIRIELALLHQLCNEAERLIDAVRHDRADSTERLAAGCTLQSFYNGAERALAAIAERLDGGWDRQGDDNARRALLESMAAPAEGRPAVIDDNLAGQLERYLEFRESFRYAHFYRLRWEEISPLVIDLPKTLEALEGQVEAFLAAASGQKVPPTPDVEMPTYWTRPIKLKRSTVATRTLVASWLVAAFIGLFLGIGIVQMRSKPIRRPKTVPAEEITNFIAETSFTEPAGNVRFLPARFPEERLIVKDGKPLTGTGQAFTGRVARDRQSEAGWPVMSMSFRNGKAIFFEAVNEQEEFQRGVFRNGKLMRYSLYDSSDLPYRTFHLTSDGRVFCMIERGKYIMGGTRATHDGWYYRFYHDGAVTATVFMTADGRLIQADLGEKNAINATDARPLP